MKEASPALKLWRDLLGVCFDLKDLRHHEVRTFFHACIVPILQSRECDFEMRKRIITSHLLKDFFLSVVVPLILHLLDLFEQTGIRVLHAKMVSSYWIEARGIILEPGSH